MLYFITARVRSTREGNIYTWKCLSVHFGGVPHPYPSLSGGVPNPALDGGGTPIQPWMGGYPNPALDGGGVPQPWMGGYPNLGQGGYPISGGYPIPCPGGYPRYPHPQNSKHLLQLHGGQCASCIHAGGLSYLYFIGGSLESP